MKHGWLSDYSWLKDLWHKKWDIKTCYNEAKKYQSQKEFQKGNRSAFSAAWKHGWLEDYTWFKRPEAYNKKWTREKCEDEARKYKTRKEFKLRIKEIRDNIFQMKVNIKYLN